MAERRGLEGRRNDEAGPDICMTILVNGSLWVCQYRAHRQLVLPAREAYKTSKMELSHGTNERGPK